MSKLTAAIRTIIILSMVIGFYLLWLSGLYMGLEWFNNGRGIQYSSKYDGDNFEDDLIQAGLNKIRDHELRWIK